MSRKLTVYGWVGYRRECPKAANGGQQTREVVAATSQKAAARAAGEEQPRRLFNLGTTENEEEIEVAMAHPGVVFWHPLDQRGPGRWRRAGEMEDRDPEQEWKDLPSRLKVALRCTDEDGRWRDAAHGLDALRWGLIESREPPKHHLTEIGEALAKIAHERWEAGLED